MPVTPAYILSARATDFFVGACDPCRLPVRGDFPGARGDVMHLDCTGCGAKTRASRIYATTNDASCDGKCMGAVGPSCSCSCGGENHGCTWLPTYESKISADALNKYRGRIEKQEQDKRQKAETELRRRRSEFDDWAEQHADVVEFLKSSDIDNDFIEDMRRSLSRWNTLTERQSAGVRKFIEGAKRRAEEAKRRAVEAANAGPAPEGRITVEGEVVMVRDYPSAYTDTLDYRMIVRLDNGARVFGTVPKSLQGRLLSVEAYENGFWLTGVRVRFDATVTPKTGEPTFGFFKRPTKAVRL